jgi:predicted dehydrogenase
MKIAIISQKSQYPLGHYQAINQRYPNLELIGCADWDDQPDSIGLGIPSMKLNDLLNSQAEIIINLAPPAFRVAATMQILAANKHVYVERPFAQTLLEANQILEFSRAKGLRVACGQDCFLGVTWQAVRQAVDTGLIGQVLNVQVSLQHKGAESWLLHSQDLYSRYGFINNLWYPLGVLIWLFGAVKSLSAMTFQNPMPRFTHDQQPIAVETPTYFSALLEFENHLPVNLIMTVDTLATQVPVLEIHGSHGTILAQSMFAWADLAWYNLQPAQTYQARDLVQVPRPAPYWKQFLRQFIRNPNGQWKALQLPKHRYITRGCGVSELASAIVAKRSHRTSIEIATHILEIILSLEESAKTGQRQTLSSHISRPEAL